MRHHKAKNWELRLKSVFDEIDQELESTYGNSFDLHPSRPERDSTSNPEMDGLFNVGASYSAGFGSKLGPGYVVDIRISTLERVPASVKAELKTKVKALLETKLPVAFPGKALTVHEEHHHLRITGDLSLD
jgi:hypothetical protein